jgi:hypothetical protein
MQRDGQGLGNAKFSVSHYFSRNFHLTTRGHFHTKGLLDAISNIGVDRLLFSEDYPYESLFTASRWFDNALRQAHEGIRSELRKAWDFASPRSSKVRFPYSGTSSGIYYSARE